MKLYMNHLYLLLQVSWNVNSVNLNLELQQITVFRYRLVEWFQCFVELPSRITRV